MRLLLIPLAVGAVVALSHPTSRRALLRWAVWPVRDLIRRDWDRAREERVSPDRFRRGGLA